jgi:hypothetical protein
LAFRTEDCRDGVASTFPNYHNNLELAGFVPGQTAVTAMCFDIGWPSDPVAWAEISRPVMNRQLLPMWLTIVSASDLPDYHLSSLRDFYR